MKMPCHISDEHVENPWDRPDEDIPPMPRGTYLNEGWVVTEDEEDGE